MSITDIAKAKGKSKQAISKRVNKLAESGAITVRREGTSVLVNLVEYDRATKEHTDPAQALRNPGLAIDGLAPPPADEPDENAEPQTRGYLKHKEVRAAYGAENDRLDLDERLLKLVDKADTEHRVFNIFRRLRDRILSVPAICAPRVAHVTDERAVKTIIDDELRKVLTALAADLDKAGSDEEDDASLDTDAEDIEGAEPIQ
jgi:DNA-binding transcriptional ArsR family regulator